MPLFGLKRHRRNDIALYVEISADETDSGGVNIRIQKPLKLPGSFDDQRKVRRISSILHETAVTALHRKRKNSGSGRPRTRHRTHVKYPPSRLMDASNTRFASSKPGLGRAHLSGTQTRIACGPRFAQE